MLEGLAQWNQARALASAQQKSSMRVFDLQLASKVGLAAYDITIFTNYIR